MVTRQGILNRSVKGGSIPSFPTRCTGHRKKSDFQSPDRTGITICREMYGKHFLMKYFQPGVTAPPFHVWCRSCTCPYFDDEFTENETRAARGEDGKTYQVPADMKYPEWKKAFVDGDKSGFEEGINPLSGMTEYGWKKGQTADKAR